MFKGKIVVHFRLCSTTYKRSHALLGRILFIARQKIKILIITYYIENLIERKDYFIHCINALSF